MVDVESDFGWYIVCGNNVLLGLIEAHILDDLIAQLLQVSHPTTTAGWPVYPSPVSTCGCEATMLPTLHKELVDARSNSGVFWA